MKNINFCVPQIQIINNIKYTNLQKQIKLTKYWANQISDFNVTDINREFF
jgi:hypothetical protein